MEYIFILNRFSLKEKLEDVKKRLEKVSKKKKLKYKIEINNEEVSTEDIVEKYKKKRVCIVAVGGDGTINRVLNKVVGTKNVLGFIPYGTGNDFYKSCQELLKEGIQTIDLVKINEKYCINVACFGIDAEIGNNDDIIHSKWIPAKQRYNMSLIHHFLKFQPREVRVKVNKIQWNSPMTTIVLCNGRYYGGGYKVGFTSQLNNGKIDVYLINQMPKIKMATLINGMKKGLHEKSIYTTKVQAKELTIESDSIIESNIDGEKYASKIFKVKVIPKGITINYDQSLIDAFYGKK
ncbi:MAG: hypothetical protein J6X28_03800 [Bacilli bacterium]|nr:hypothetical protein [Bacilli bacterium]